MGKNIGKNIIKNLSSKYSQKLLNHAKQSAIDSFKTASKRAIQKQQKLLLIWLEIKLLIELQKSQKLKKILDLIQNYTEKAIYLQRRKIIDDASII